MLLPSGISDKGISIEAKAKTSAEALIVEINMDTNDLAAYTPPMQRPAVKKHIFLVDDT